MSNPRGPCLHACYKPATVALEYALVCHHSGMGVADLQPSALDSAWNLKSRPPLLSPPLAYLAYLAGIVTGALSNARHWCHTWAGEMLSLGAWLQIALLSGYQHKQVARAAHSAVTRALATSPNTLAQTVRFMYSLLPHLPMPHCCHLTFCAGWIRRQAHWAGDKYSNWFLPLSLSPNGISGDWCSDWNLLLSHATTVRHPDHVCPQWEDVLSPEICAVIRVDM